MGRTRGAFDRLMDVYATVNGIVALTPHITDVPCRFVYQSQIVPELFPFSGRVAWITYNATAPIQPFVLSGEDEVTISWKKADRLVVSGMPNIFWYQLLTEIVNPSGEPGYLRSWVSEVVGITPPPPP
jgi:hypothetical protein